MTCRPVIEGRSNRSKKPFFSGFFDKSDRDTDGNTVSSGSDEYVLYQGGVSQNAILFEFVQAGSS
jgi:hypothetical protein